MYVVRLYIRILIGKPTTLKSLKDNFQHFLEDKESGTIPIFERKNGKLLKVMIDEGTINHIHIHQIDRCARNLKAF